MQGAKTEVDSEFSQSRSRNCRRQDLSFGSGRHDQHEVDHFASEKQRSGWHTSAAKGENKVWFRPKLKYAQGLFRIRLKQAEVSRPAWLQMRFTCAAKSAEVEQNSIQSKGRA